VGSLGYLFAYRELAEQCEEQSLDLDWVVLASSSGGTQAGLVAGWAESGGKLHGRSVHILGISIDEPAAGLHQTVFNLAEGALERLDIQVRPALADVLVNADYLGEGYGVLGPPEREAILRFARSEGLLLDPVYTGRAAAGLIDLSRKGFFKPGENVLFWHTGGAPALFAEQYG
jgi:1-aminocyclopropane-1-carboxylate deaminase/D-cysteine desulfhydrase-like pyridoxal-dependent ACC family enzyme